MTQESEISHKLDVIIKLLALDQLKGKEVGEQIVFLSNIGISNKEIATILNKSQNTVNATLSQWRKKENDKED